MVNLEKDEEKKKTKAALSILGNAYIVVPRSIFADLYGSDKEEREAAWLYLLLLVQCNYEDRPVMLNGIMYNARRGEYIGTYRRLSEMARIPFGSIRRLINFLVKKGLIDSTKLSAGLRIFLYGYHELTCPGRRQPVEKMELTPFQQLMAYEEKITKGIRC